MGVMKVLGMMMLFVAVSGLALAQVQTPEIDPGSAGTAVALLSGALLVIRASRKK
jgi:hypothetical protein